MDEAGRTSVSMPVLRGQEEVVELLVGADITWDDKRGKTPLSLSPFSLRLSRASPKTD